VHLIVEQRLRMTDNVFAYMNNAHSQHENITVNVRICSTRWLRASAG
jgi:predicted DNA-binding ribbon-helix-helix protein